MTRSQYVPNPNIRNDVKPLHAFRKLTPHRRSWLNSKTLNRRLVDLKQPMIIEIYRPDEEYDYHLFTHHDTHVLGVTMEHTFLHVIQDGVAHQVSIKRANSGIYFIED